MVRYTGDHLKPLHLQCYFRETGIRDPSALDPLSRLEYLVPIDQRMTVTDGTYLFKEEEEFSMYS